MFFLSPSSLPVKLSHFSHSQSHSHFPHLYILFGTLICIILFFGIASLWPLCSYHFYQIRKFVCFSDFVCFIHAYKRSIASTGDQHSLIRLPKARIPCSCLLYFLPLYMIVRFSTIRRVLINSARRLSLDIYICLLFHIYAYEFHSQQQS